jgi:hypothetical protein
VYAGVVDASSNSSMNTGPDSFPSNKRPGEGRRQRPPETV